jgi:D-glycero-D-manno-heptose 1,7-bisphosphate phosphatase
MRVDRKTEEAVKSLRVEFDHLILITNQTYFARVASPNITDLNNYKRNARDLAVHLEADMLLSCHHHPEAENLSLRRNCEYRKPNSGMLEKAINVFGLSPEKSVLVGDRITDIQAASSVNIGNRFLIANPRAFEVNISPQTIIEPGLHFRAINSLAELGSFLERGTCD